MTVLYVGPGPTAEEPGMVITDDPCPECGWPETIIKVYGEDNSVAKGCAGCERVEWLDPAPLRTDSQP